MQTPKWPHNQVRCWRSKKMQVMWPGLRCTICFVVFLALSPSVFIWWRVRETLCATISPTPLPFSLSSPPTTPDGSPDLRPANLPGRCPLRAALVRRGVQLHGGGTPYSQRRTCMLRHEEKWCLFVILFFGFPTDVSTQCTCTIYIYKCVNMMSMLGVD